jgi:hypothetical protein
VNAPLEIPRFERDLKVHVAVSTIQDGEEMVDHEFITARIAKWRSANAACGLTGALLISGDGIVHVLEGSEAAIHKQRRRLDRESMHTNVRHLAESSCTKRRFAGWALAYIPSSRWVERALADHPLAEMQPNSENDAKFLIDLVLDFVGDGA